MPNVATARHRHRGWFFDQVNNRLAAVYNGTEVFDFDANDMVVTPATTFSAGVTMDTTLLVTGVATFTATPVFNSATATTFNSDVLTANGFGQVIGHSAQITMNALVPEFQVVGSTVGVDGAAAVGLYSSTAGNGPLLNFFRSKSATLGTNTIVASGDSLGGIQWLGADGSTGFDPAAAIIAEVAGTPGASCDMPGRILFQTSPDATQTPATRMTVLAGATTVAQVQLGTAGTSTGSLVLAGVTSGTIKLSAASAAGACLNYVFPAAYAACSGMQLTCNTSGALSWAAASVGAYKNDLGVVCTNEMLQAVVNAPVHRFTYNRDKLPTGQWAGECEFVGIFGEEAPWAMQGARKQAISTINSVGALTASIQALNKRLEALEARN